MTRDVQSVVLAQQQSQSPPLQLIMSGQSAIMQSMNQHFDRLQVEMDKNNELQGQLVQMQQKMDANQQRMQQQMESKQQEMQELQQQMDAKQQQMYQLQQETNEELLEKQQEMLQMQQQALDRLAVIQSSVLALVTQTYELHEYPIPRLFIVLPKTLGFSGKIKSLIADQFRLYFLCECGTHTMSEDTKTPHHIHLAKHEGYDLEKPTVFFERYGSYVLRLMQMIKYGITAAGLIVPPLANSKIVEGLDTAQKHMDYLKKNFAPLVDDTIKFLGDIKSHQEMGQELSADHMEFARLEALEGADLRQLESYLKVKDKGRVLGNLYRIVTLEGHVKWVCFDHYRATYRETTIKRLQEIVSVNGGDYSSETGSIKISLATHTQAKQFYDAMTNARCIQELDITLKWDATMDELRKFAKAVTMANVISLTVNGTFFKSPALDVVNRTRRFDPIMQLASNARLQSLQINDFGDFFARVSKSALSSSPKLRTLLLRSELSAEDKVKSLGHILTLYSALTTLEVKLPPGTTITEAVPDVLSKLPKLESLNVNCGMSSIAASVKNGEIQDTVLMSDKLSDLLSGDFDVIQGKSSTMLLVKVTPQDGHIDRLLGTLVTAAISRIQLTYRGRPRVILAAPEWTLQDLDGIVVPELSNGLSISVDCGRLFLFTENRYWTWTREALALYTTITIERLGRLNTDDLRYIQQLYQPTKLVITRIPRDGDKDRLTEILHQSQKLDHLEVKYGEAQDPTIGNDPEMKFLDLVTIAISASASARRLRSFSIDYQRLSITASRSWDGMSVELTVAQISGLHPDELQFIRKGQVRKLVIMQTPRAEDKDRLIDVLQHNQELGRLDIRYRKEHDLTADNGFEMKLQDLTTVIASATTKALKSFSIICRRCSLVTNCGSNEGTDMVIERLDLLESDDLEYIQQGHLTKLVLMRIPREGEKDRLANILYRSQKLKSLEFKYGEAQDSVIDNEPEMRFFDLVTLVTRTIAATLESFLIDYQRISLTTIFGFDKGMYMNIERLDRLRPDDFAFNQQFHITRLTICQIPRIEEKDRLIDALCLSRTLCRLEIEYRKDQEPATLENPEMKLLDLVTVVTSNTNSLALLSIQYQRLKLTAKMLRSNIQDAVMTTIRLKDLHSDDLKLMGHFPARLEIKDIPLHTDKGRLALIFQLNIPHLHLQIGCGEKSPLVYRGALRPFEGTEDDMKFQDVVGMATSICKIKSLRIDYRELSIKIGVSQGVTQKVDMAITTLGVLSLQDVEFIKQRHLTRLTTWYDQGLGDEIWWIEFIRSSQSLTHLQVGCKGEFALSLVDLVVSNRNDTLQRRGSCSLRTFELMDNPLVPFDVLANRDATLHIKSHITFPDDSITFDMRTWIRFEKMSSLRHDHPVVDFIFRFGWSIVLLDGYILGAEIFASLLNTILNTGSHQLESLIVYSSGQTSRGDLLDEVIKRSPNFKKLGVYLRLSVDVELVLALLSRYGTIISKIQLSEGTPEQWSRISSSFTSRHHFPILESLEVLPTPDALVRHWELLDLSCFVFPSDCTSWIMTMVSAPPPRGSTASIAQLSPRRGNSVTDDPNIVHLGTTLAESWIPLRKIVLRQVELRPEEWRTVVEALDFSVLEYLDLQESNFSMEQFKVLMECLPENSDSNIPLQTLDVVGTHLAQETDIQILEEMMAPLLKKAPSIAISIYNLNPLLERNNSCDSDSSLESELQDWGLH